MIVTESMIRPVYRWVRDQQYSSGQKAIMQMNVMFVITGFLSGQHDIEPTTASLLSDLRVRSPNTDVMPAFIEPDLTPSRYTFYDRATLIEGADYTDLPVAAYDWKISDGKEDQDPNDGSYITWYQLSGRWHRYMGLFYNVTHRI